MTKITKNSTYIPIQHNKKSLLNRKYAHFSPAKFVQEINLPAKLVQGISIKIRQNLVKKRQILSKQDKNRQKQVIFSQKIPAKFVQVACVVRAGIIDLPAKFVQVACVVRAGIYFINNYFNLYFLTPLLNVFTNVLYTYIAKTQNFINFLTTKKGYYEKS